MYQRRIAALVLACVAVCLGQDITEPSVSSSLVADNSTVTPPPASTAGSSASSAAASATSAAEGSTSAEHTATSASSGSTLPPSGTGASDSTAVGGESAPATTEGADESSAAVEVTETDAPGTTVAPSSAAATAESSSVPEATPDSTAAPSADSSETATTAIADSSETATTVLASITEVATTTVSSSTSSAETAAKSTSASPRNTTLAPTSEGSLPPETATAAETTNTTVATETTTATERHHTVSSQPASTSSATTPDISATTAAPAEVASSEVTSSVTQSPSPSASADPAEETSRAETESARHTSPATDTEEPVTTTEAAGEQTTTPPVEDYGYPRSMPKEEMQLSEVDGAVTMALAPRRIGFLAWLGMKESLLRSTILGITRDNGFNTSELEWVYISPTPAYRPPHIVLNFLIMWRGGRPTNGTVTPTAAAETGPSASPSGGDPTRPARPTPSLVTSDTESTSARRRRRAVGQEEGGVVPAKLLTRLITDNADKIGKMVSADIESTSAGLEASHGACPQEDSGFLSSNGSIMLALSVATGVCLCLACGALLYVRLIRDSGHWEPQPAYHEGDRVGGLDLHSDADCQKGEQPPDSTGAEVYPLSSVPSTPRGSTRADARV